MSTSSDKSKTSPLSRAARESFNPTNKDLMDELTYQSGKIEAIDVKADRIEAKGDATLKQAMTTNGRVTQLEVDTKPLLFLYRNFRMALAVGVFCAPVIFKIMEIALDHIWPTK